MPKNSARGRVAMSTVAAVSDVGSSDKLKVDVIMFCIQLVGLDIFWYNHSVTTEFTRTAFVFSLHQKGCLIHKNNDSGIPTQVNPRFFQMVKGLSTCYSAAYMRRLVNSSDFTILEVTADWHELAKVWHIMWPSAARDSEQLDPWCSMTDIPPPISATLGLHPIARKLLLINQRCN